MLFHDVIELFLANFMAQFFHSCLDIFFRNETASVCVKLLENYIQLVVSEYLLYADSGSEELRIVDLFVPRIIHFFNNFFYLLIID